LTVPVSSGQGPRAHSEAEIWIVNVASVGVSGDDWPQSTPLETVGRVCGCVHDDMLDPLFGSSSGVKDARGGDTSGASECCPMPHSTADPPASPEVPRKATVPVGDGDGDAGRDCHSRAATAARAVLPL
jgi:hypothetical protein